MQSKVERGVDGDTHVYAAAAGLVSVAWRIHIYIYIFLGKYYVARKALSSCVSLLLLLPLHLITYSNSWLGAGWPSLFLLLLLLYFPQTFSFP